MQVTYKKRFLRARTWRKWFFSFFLENFSPLRMVPDARENDTLGLLENGAGRWCTKFLKCGVAPCCSGTDPGRNSVVGFQSIWPYKRFIANFTHHRIWELSYFLRSSLSEIYITPLVSAPAWNVVFDGHPNRAWGCSPGRPDLSCVCPLTNPLWGGYPVIALSAVIEIVSWLFNPVGIARHPLTLSGHGLGCSLHGAHAYRYRHGVRRQTLDKSMYLCWLASHE